MAAEPKLRKVTLNLFDEDCRKLERWYGHGWTAEVRKRINDFVLEREQFNAQMLDVVSYKER
jgi:hypothetical protein